MALPQESDRDDGANNIRNQTQTFVKDEETDNNVITI